MLKFLNIICLEGWVEIEGYIVDLPEFVKPLKQPNLLRPITIVFREVGQTPSPNATPQFWFRHNLSFRLKFCMITFKTKFFPQQNFGSIEWERHWNVKMCPSTHFQSSILSISLRHLQWPPWIIICSATKINNQCVLVYGRRMVPRTYVDLGNKIKPGHQIYFKRSRKKYIVGNNIQLNSVADHSHPKNILVHLTSIKICKYWWI